MTMYLYTDGACSGNPGPGGWAVVHIDPLETKVLFTKYGNSPKTTNNAMELRALLEAFHWATEYPGDMVRIFSDSSYAVKGIMEWMKNWEKRGWKKADGTPVLNPELWKELSRLWDPTKMSLTHIRGHAGIFGNEQADKYAVAARDGKI